MANLDKIVEEVSELTALELSDLVKKIEEKFGVSAAMPVMVTAGGAGGTAGAREGKTTFRVELKAAGGQKTPGINVLRVGVGFGKFKYFGGVGKRKNLIGACEKKAHTFPARAGPEKFVQNLRHYFNSTTAPAASSFCFNSWAAALSIPSFTTFGAASARSFASLSPEPRTSRKTLMT